PPERQAADSTIAVPGLGRTDLLHPALAALAAHHESGVPSGPELQLDDVRQPRLEPLLLRERLPQLLRVIGQLQLPFDQLTHVVTPSGGVGANQWPRTSVAQPAGCSIAHTSGADRDGLRGIHHMGSWRTLQRVVACVTSSRGTRYVTTSLMDFS